MVFHGVAYAGGVVTTINPTYVEREVHHQLLDADARLLVTIAPFLEVARAAVVGHRRRGDLRHRRGRRDGRPPAHRADGRAARRAGARRRRRHRRAALLLRHDRRLQGRDADAPQPRRQRGADARRRRPARRRDDRGRAAVLPHLRHAGADELRAARGRHDRHAAALRPRAVPLGPPGVRRHPVVRRAADRRRAGQAPARRQVRPVHARAGLLGRGAAVGRAGPGGREAPRLRGGPGLRHDRAVTGHPHHARRPVQAGLGRRHRAQHRDAHRRPADGRRPRRRRRRRDLGARAAGHEGLPQQRAGHVAHHRRRRLAAHRRHRARRRGRPRLRRRPAQGADQVQGLPGRARPSSRPCCSPTRTSPTPP